MRIKTSGFVYVNRLLETRNVINITRDFIRVMFVGKTDLFNIAWVIGIVIYMQVMYISCFNPTTVTSNFVIVYTYHVCKANGHNNVLSPISNWHGV